jgi:hypothetical protein
MIYTIVGAGAGAASRYGSSSDQKIRLVKDDKVTLEINFLDPGLPLHAARRSKLTMRLFVPEKTLVKRAHAQLNLLLILGCQVR